NVVLRLHPALAPIKVGVFPLVNKLREKSREIFDPLKEEFECFFDASGSIGRRYARADEQGIAYCVTVDFETLDDASVTVRDRDTTAQVRVKIGDIADTLSKLLSGKVAFSDAGKAV
ncbi:TPA: glycine--tRNA ligase, partial [Candidatus Woesearchaeota archaeon]|nr:glycine--tRNA ligase [Candidatus Woesearchaeota archaeon]